MAHRYLISQDSPCLYITLVTKDRHPVFRKDELKEVMCKAIDEARKYFLLFAYVIMIDHLHVLTSRPSTTSEVLRTLKGITARRVIDYLKENNYPSSLSKLRHQTRDRNYQHSLWQTEKNVLEVYSERLFREKLNYIHQNPVRAGLWRMQLTTNGPALGSGLEVLWMMSHLKLIKISSIGVNDRNEGRSPNQGRSPIAGTRLAARQSRRLTSGGEAEASGNSCGAYPFVIGKRGARTRGGAPHELRWRRGKPSPHIRRRSRG